MLCADKRGRLGVALAGGLDGILTSEGQAPVEGHLTRDAGEGSGEGVRRGPS